MIQRRESEPDAGLRIQWVPFGSFQWNLEQAQNTHQQIIMPLFISSENKQTKTKRKKKKEEWQEKSKAQEISYGL